MEELQPTRGVEELKMLALPPVEDGVENKHHLPCRAFVQVVPSQNSQFSVRQ